MAATTGLVIAILVAIFLAAFLPCLLYLEWLRNLERDEREPWRELFKMFAWGAIIGVAIALVVNTTVGNLVSPTFRGFTIVFLAVAVAPLVEEAAKASGLWLVKDPHLEKEDGIVYGAAAGFGFAATENVMYGLTSLVMAGLGGWAVNAILRALSSALLHASASALLGYGWSKRRATGAGSILPYYLGAAGLHALFNAVAVSGGLFLEAGYAVGLVTLPVSIGIAWAGFLFARSKLTSIEAARPDPKPAEYVDPLRAYAPGAYAPPYAPPARPPPAHPPGAYPPPAEPPPAYPPPAYPPEEHWPDPEERPRDEDDPYR